MKTMLTSFQCCLREHRMADGEVGEEPQACYRKGKGKKERNRRTRIKSYSLP